MPAREPIVAGGGVVYRPGPRGLLVLLVHRPRYGDWSLPKGKLERGETVASAALREVEEETGQRCVLGALVDEVVYRVDEREKKVVFFLMEPLDGFFDPSEEVDRVAWLSFEAAAARVSYDGERRVLEEAATLLGDLA